MTGIRGFSWPGATVSKEKAMGFLLPLVLAAGFILFNQYKNHNLYKDLDNHGRQTMATILDKRIVRYGTDRPSFTYQMRVGFTVGDKMIRGHVQVTREFYEQHHAPQRVPIRYLPDKLHIREVDPAMRDQSKRRNRTIIGLLVFIAFANLFVVGNKRQKTLKGPNV